MAKGMKITTQDIFTVYSSLKRVTEDFDEIRQHIIRAEQLITQLRIEDVIDEIEDLIL